jgi:transcription initiation factor TFIIH subunit 3
MEASHLSVVLDLSPTEWHRSTTLPLDVFLAQLLVFLNAYIALEHDNSLAVFAALPNKRYFSPFLLIFTQSF